MAGERSWVVEGEGAPTTEDDALVAAATGWPDDATLGPSPLRWARALMAGVNAAVGDPAWRIDPLSLRLVEAWTVVAVGPVPEGDRGAPVRVEVGLRQVVALGALTGLRLGLEVRSARGEGLATAGLTIAGRGDGLVGGTRPLPPDGPVAPPSPADEAGDPADEAEVAVEADAVAAFSRWVRDPTPIHTDPAAAREAGLRGPIAPGMSVLGVLAASAAGAARRPVVGVGARFVRPTVVGDRLALRVRGARRVPPDGPSRLPVAAVGPEGPVVRRAWVDVAAPGGSVPADVVR